MIFGLPALAYIAQQEKVLHTFAYVADNPLKSVHLAGTFNGWDKGATPMTNSGGNTWQAKLSLEPGKHYYKFVLDGETWITDPKAEKNEDDGGGNINSVLLVVPSDYSTAANPDDGAVTLSALKHETQVPYLNYDRGKLTLTFRYRPKDVKSVSVALPGGRKLPLKQVSANELYALAKADVPWDRKQDLNYSFLLEDGKRFFSYGPGGLSLDPRGESFKLSAKQFRSFEVPSWVEKSVFYQIFPDRFENSRKDNDPASVQAWTDEPTYSNRYGGDIAGIQKRLPHLTNLGINAIYFNPIFKSPSNHRYETSDYRQVDPEFGTNEEFVDLTKTLKSKGIRVILDGVFNHTAVDYRPFADIREKGERSAFKDWYFINSYPVKVQEKPNYVAWFGFPSMPKVNLENPDARKEMLDVVDFWHKTANIDGWRLDVANEVSMDYWREFRNRVKGLDPNMWIVGEVWGDGSPWLKGDQWDSVMNYQFREAVLGFVANGSTSPNQFLNRLVAVHESYAPQVSRNMMNLLSSHDTPRFLTLCGGDKDLAKMGAAFQFTWVGAPSIYYGEEIGMEGGKDPENRRGMRWDLANDSNPMLGYYRQLVALRSKNEALQSGDPHVLLVDDTNKTGAYARVLDQKAALVVFNRSDRAQEVKVPLDSLNSLGLKKLPTLDWNTSRLHTVSGSTLTLRLAPKSVAIMLQPGASSSLRAYSRPSAVGAGIMPQSARRLK